MFCQVRDLLRIWQNGLSKQKGFILEESKLVFSDDITIVEDLDAGRVLRCDRDDNLFTIKKRKVLNKDFSSYFNQ